MAIRGLSDGVGEQKFFITCQFYGRLTGSALLFRLWQLHVAGHEIGHMVDFRHDTINVNSIMTKTARDTIPQNRYFQVDLDSFLVKPRLP